jgi:hypothetical protein
MSLGQEERAARIRLWRLGLPTALILALPPHLFDRFTACGKCPIFFEHGLLVLLECCDLLDPLAAAQLALQGNGYQS